MDLRVLSPRGVPATLRVREGTNDAATIHATFCFDGKVSDEYGLRDLHIADGWAMDVGAHIGSVAIALALDEPEARVIAVEAVPENADLLRTNAAMAGVADRVHVVEAAAAGEDDLTATIHYGHYDAPGIPPDHAEQARFIGNLFREHGSRGIDIEVPAVGLGGLLTRFGIERLAFLKIDCEGCEWAFLDSPALDRVDRITGEYHDRGGSAIVALLARTHRVELMHEDGGSGLFRAVHHMLGALP